MMSEQRGPAETAPAATMMTRRAMLRGAMRTAGALGVGALVPGALAAQRGGANAARPDSTLALARFLNQHALPGLSAEGDRAREDDPRQHVRERRGGIASIDSARILRQLAKEQGGRPEATIWFDGTRVPAVERRARQRRPQRRRGVGRQRHPQHRPRRDDARLGGPRHRRAHRRHRTGSARRDGPGIRGGGPDRRSPQRRARRPARLADRRVRRRRRARRSS